MTSSNSTVKAVSNGTATTTADVPRPARAHGIIRAREQQIYHLASLVQAALFEAEQLAGQIQRTATPSFDDKVRDPVDLAHVADVVIEALDCIDLAAEHLSMLSCALRTDRDDDSF
jgi:hypothetical protein